MKTGFFDFDLHESLIAAHPVSPRDAARMLVVGPKAWQGIVDDAVANLTAYLRPGDIMVFNDTKVIPARLFARRGEAKIELLLHKQCVQIGAGDSNNTTLWQCFARPAKKLRPGDRLVIADDFEAEILEKLLSGEVLVRFAAAEFFDQLQRYGHMPLPPYIERQREQGGGSDKRSADRAALSHAPCEGQEARSGSDKETYQTVYARHDGSVAAPTAGLHFTDRLLAAIDAAGVQRAHVTLHVGGGTFLPVKVEDTDQHVMHSEYAVITRETADMINLARAAGGRVIAVGTTSLRTLESAADADGMLQPFAQETSIFITPGYRFRLVDVLLTNFHLPRSTLFMLVSAFSGLDTMQAAYRHAIAKRYRFYSYGDACLLFPSVVS